MKKSKFFVCVFFCLLTSFFWGQTHWCAFDKIDSLHNTNREVFEKQLSSRMSRPNALTINQIYRIPVVVHVVHNNNTDLIGLGNNISDEQIFSALEVLNEDFRRKNPDSSLTPAWARPVAGDFQMEFVLATQDPFGVQTNGITRHRTDKNGFSISSTDEKSLKSYGYWPSDQYLNIWVANLTGGIVGYAQFPDNSGLTGINDVNGSALTDGVVIAPFAFGRLSGKANGSNNPYRFGRSAVHEIGHWVGLKHIFNSDENGCNYTDYCGDTPPQNKSNIGLSICDETIVGECNAVVMFMNYMDYTNDVCMNIFTKDQKARAHAAMETSPRRAALKFSKGLCGSSNKLELPYLENFEDESLLSKNWQLSSSSDTIFWVLEKGKLVGVSSKISKDSLILKSGVMDYKNSENYKLRFSLSPDLKSADSITVYYEWACSGERKLLKTIYISSSLRKEEIIDLKNLSQDGLINFYFVIYSNGNSIALDEISIYQESESLEIDLFPNPSNGKFTYLLKMKGDQKLIVSVHDLNGKELFFTEEIVYSGSFPLDLSFLNPNAYIIKFITESETKSLKLIIE